jgi:outer membrane lipoprotein-sorting protein
MSRTPLLRRGRWAVPAAIAAGVVVAAITMNGAGATVSPNLKPMTSADLLTAVANARPSALSGTIVETADLGLPDLPTSQLPGGGGLSLETLLTGSHTMRVWYDGPSRQRIALLAPLSERDVIHNGSDLWTFTSTTNEVTHATVPQDQPSAAGPDLMHTTPPSVARELLSRVDPSTAVTVDRTATVAGRAAYQLVLTPRDSRTLVGSTRIAVDAATYVPLQVQVYAAGASAPAFQVGFTDVSFSRPAASLFDFTPPSGSKVTQQQLSGMSGEHTRHAESATHEAASAKPTVLGSGWTSVVVVPGGAAAVNGLNSDLLDNATTAVPTGRLITTALFSVLIGTDGNVYVGAVNGSMLQQVAASGHGL